MNNFVTTHLNLDEMDQFLERHNSLKLTQREPDNLNSLISIKEIKSIINNLIKKERTRP